MKARFCYPIVAVAAVLVLLGSRALAAPPAAGARVAPAQVYSSILDSMEREIVGAAEAMPANKYNFAPPSSPGNFVGVRTFGQQVKHLAEANYDMFGRVGVKPSADVKGINNLTSKDDIVKALKDSYVFAHQVIDTITAENAFVSLDAHDNTRAGFATQALIHANDHYGQMVEYLRMNGVIPPASRR